MKALVIEDNARLAERITYKLKDWFTLDVAKSGHEGLVYAEKYDFDIVLLDLGLPDMHGLEVCKRLRKVSPNIPILVLTGVDDTASKIDLLNSGADDYLTKPFNSKELRARMNALIRRRARMPFSPEIKAGDLVMDIEKRTVERAGVEVTLRRKEFDILECLLKNQGRVVTREALVHYAWSSLSNKWSGSVDVHIKHLRDKIDRPFSYPLVRTMYSIGYIIDLKNKSTAKGRK